MSQRFKPRVRAQEAAPPFNRFDSELDLPSRGNHRTNDMLKKNAWLTLRTRIHLNFVDAHNRTGWHFNPATGNVTPRTDNYIKTEGRRTLAKDHSGAYHRIMNWTPEFIKMFRQKYVERGQKRWNFQFLLKPPRRYCGLDLDFNFDTKVRPNLICLFRLELVSLAQRPHHVVNVVRLDLSATPGKLPDSATYQSDSANYDDMDLWNPAAPPISPSVGIVTSDTVGHEIGHALGQGHVLELMGKPCAPKGTVFPGNECSGTTDWEKANIMSWGDRIYTINAISWQSRAAVHCPGTRPEQWQASMVVNTPPQLVR